VRSAKKKAISSCAPKRTESASDTSRDRTRVRTCSNDRARERTTSSAGPRRRVRPWSKTRRAATYLRLHRRTSSALPTCTEARSLTCDPARSERLPDTAVPPLKQTGPVQARRRTRRRSGDACCTASSSPRRCAETCTCLPATRGRRPADRGALALELKTATIDEGE
jgi:hypothetical protein